MERERLRGSEALWRAGLAPLELQPKESISLLNGTQAMLALGCLQWLEAETLIDAADVICALALDALRGTITLKNILSFRELKSFELGSLNIAKGAPAPLKSPWIRSRCNNVTCCRKSERRILRSAGLNVLIGANASGKSNLIEAIGLLKAAPANLGFDGAGIRSPNIGTERPN